MQIDKDNKITWLQNEAMIPLRDQCDELKEYQQKNVSYKFPNKESELKFEKLMVELEEFCISQKK